MTRDELEQVEHVGFALYGFSPSACPVAQLYQWALDWFARLDCAPDIGGADVGGRESQNYKPFRNVDRKARAASFAGVTNWTLLDIPDDLSGEKHGQMFGEDMAVTYSTKPFTKCLVFHLREIVVHNRMGEFLEAAKQACELLRPQYGIGYRRAFHFGPLLYGMGMRQNGFAAADDDNMEYWSTMLNHDGYTLLRSVYPWNFVTETQLDIPVGTLRLEDWVCSGPGRGKLTPFTDRVTLWTVPDDAVRPVRDALWEVGVVLDRKRHFESRMYEYHVDEDAVAESIKTGVPLVRQPRGPGISEAEMMQNILGAFGGPKSRVRKKEASGELRELSESEVERMAKGKKAAESEPRG